MKSILGIILIILGIFAGVYVGLWWAFIGGIIVVIQEIRAEELVAMNIALGIIRIIFASFLGTITAMFFIVTGITLIK